VTARKAKTAAATVDTTAVQAGSDRASLAVAIRALADFVEAGDAIMDSCMEARLTVFNNDLDKVRELMGRSPGDWNKEDAGAWIAYNKRFLVGGRTFATYTAYVSKASTGTCQQVQVGTRHVEAHDEPVFEWRCTGAEEPVTTDDIAAVQELLEPVGFEGSGMDDQALRDNGIIG